MPTTYIGNKDYEIDITRHNRTEFAVSYRAYRGWDADYKKACKENAKNRLAIEMFKEIERIGNRCAGITIVESVLEDDATFVDLYRISVVVDYS